MQGHEFHAHATQAVDFVVDDAIGQTELGNAILEHAAYLVQSLKHGDTESPLGHVASKRQSGRPTPHHRHARCVGRHSRSGLRGIILVGKLPIGGKSLEIAYGHGRTFHLVVNATALALLLLRTHTAAHGRKRTGEFDGGCGLAKLAALDALDKTGYVDAHRATGDALRIVAVEATCGLSHRLLGGDALVHLLVASDAIGRVELRHDHAVDGRTLLGVDALAQLHAPLRIA